MSIDPSSAASPVTPSGTPGCRTLEDYVKALVWRLGVVDPLALARMREVVGSRRARIALDAESVEIRFEAAALLVDTPSPQSLFEGEGETDRSTTLDLLNGHLEITDAILENSLRATGTIEDIARMFQAIEILLDGSVRNPALQTLSRDYFADPCRSAAVSGYSRQKSPDCLSEAEGALLKRLDLLP